MVRKRTRYENNGTFQTLFTVNFRDEENVSEIFQLFQGNRIWKEKWLKYFANCNKT